MLAKVANDAAGNLTPCGVSESIASKDWASPSLLQERLPYQQIPSVRPLTLVA